MKRLEAKYQTGKALAFASIFAAFAVILLLLPPSQTGRRSLVSEDGLTLLGGIVVLIILSFASLGTFYAVCGLLGRPALSFDGQYIRTHFLPFRRIPQSEVKHSEVFSEEVKLYMSSGKTVTINVRLVKDHQTFFDVISLH